MPCTTQLASEETRLEPRHLTPEPDFYTVSPLEAYAHNNGFMMTTTYRADTVGQENIEHSNSQKVDVYENITVTIIIYEPSEGCSCAAVMGEKKKTALYF